MDESVDAATSSTRGLEEVGVQSSYDGEIISAVKHCVGSHDKEGIDSLSQDGVQQLHSVQVKSPETERKGPHQQETIGPSPSQDYISRLKSSTVSVKSLGKRLRDPEQQDLIREKDEEIKKLRLDNEGLQKANRNLQGQIQSLESRIKNLLNQLKEEIICPVPTEATDDPAANIGSSLKNR